MAQGKAPACGTRGFKDGRRNVGGALKRGVDLAANKREFALE